MSATTSGAWSTVRPRNPTSSIWPMRSRRLGPALETGVGEGDDVEVGGADGSGDAGAVGEAVDGVRPQAARTRPMAPRAAPRRNWRRVERPLSMLGSLPAEGLLRIQPRGGYEAETMSLSSLWVSVACMAPYVPWSRTSSAIAPSVASAARCGPPPRLMRATPSWPSSPTLRPPGP